ALTYAAAQAARVAFYGAHYVAARVLAREMFAGIERPPHPLPSLSETLAAMRELFAQDWENVERGLYPMPLNIATELRCAMESGRFLMDVPRVVQRRQRKAHDEVRDRAAGLPHYYQQNFHFQTDGYLSDRSAQLYDFQVEALFAGTGDAMRRRAYVPLARFFDETEVDNPVLLDVGSGTGGFLSFVKSVRPQLKTVALDLSEPYLERARKSLSRYANLEFLAAPAEAMPLPDATVDAAVSIFLFHELPPKVREAVAKEIARVLKPGGVFVLADTIQYGDVPEFDGLLDVFPELLHEPYYSSYAKTHLDALFAAAGLKRISSDIAYLTKIATFERPAR
ncbi:MAG: class I SAM-dependent methyltransferase, partial [Alphaproteobacteria bacterium]|nr:class I SAM-dependent methyltransferase [Alphaproteobacteria bacterium]